MYLNKHLEGAGLKASTNQLPPTTKKHSVPAADSFWNTWLLFHLAYITIIIWIITSSWTFSACPRSFASLCIYGHTPRVLSECHDLAWNLWSTRRKRRLCRSTRMIHCYSRWFRRMSWMTYQQKLTFWTPFVQNWRFLSWPSWRTSFSFRNQLCFLWPSYASRSFPCCYRLFVSLLYSLLTYRGRFRQT